MENVAGWVLSWMFFCASPLAPPCPHDLVSGGTRMVSACESLLARWAGMCWRCHFTPPAKLFNHRSHAGVSGSGHDKQMTGGPSVPAFPPPIFSQFSCHSSLLCLCFLTCPSATRQLPKVMELHPCNLETDCPGLHPENCRQQVRKGILSLCSSLGRSYLECCIQHCKEMEPLQRVQRRHQGEERDGAALL